MAQYQCAVVEMFEFEVRVQFWHGKFGLGVVNEVRKNKEKCGVEGMWAGGRKDEGRWGGARMACRLVGKIHRNRCLMVHGLGLVTLLSLH